MMEMGFDYLIRGEGEEAFLDICDYKIKNQKVDLDNISGLVYKKNSLIKCNKIKRINNLDVLGNISITNVTWCQINSRCTFCISLLLSHYCINMGLYNV